MTALHFWNFATTVLMIGAPIALVLRRRIIGVVYGAMLFWAAGYGWVMVQWHLAHLFDSTWLMFGLPVGFVYGLVVYAVWSGIMLTYKRWRGLKESPRIGWLAALGVALVLGLIGWQARPYGMGTSDMITALRNCPPDHVAFLWNEPSYFHNFGSIDLAQNTVQIGGSDLSDGPIGSITLTMGGCYLPVTPLNAARLARIRQLLDSLPARTPFFFQRYDFTQNIYITRWHHESREIFTYRRSELPPEAADFFRELDARVLASVKGEKP